jgi:integrase/recombinase XerD
VTSLYAADSSRKYLNAAERDRAIAAINELPRNQALYALTLTYTGARPSELLGLTSASFQLDRGIVAIRTLKRRRHSMREVPLPPSLMSALDRHFGLAHAQRDALAANRRLWPWCRQTAWRSIKGVMDRAGIVGVAASPRGLRHAFGIATLQANVPLNLVSRWMGHASLTTTAIYADATGPEEIAFATRFWRSGQAVAGQSQAESEASHGENDVAAA